MYRLRRIILTALPKVALSRLCGALASLPLPRRLRRPFFGWFARRYGADVEEADDDLEAYRSLQDFFRRSLRAGARPLATTDMVWPCDGRIVSVGAVHDGRVTQIKGHDYSLADLLGDGRLAAALDGGQQATVYLAPGDYHRVHAAFGGSVETVTAIPGTLFPVNPPAVRCIANLFARNSRHVFHCRTDSGVEAAIVMVGAYNVGDTKITCAPGRIEKGQELGRFGFGSTTIVVIGAGGGRFRSVAPETVVRMGGAASDA